MVIICQVRTWHGDHLPCAHLHGLPLQRGEGEDSILDAHMVVDHEVRTAACREGGGGIMLDAHLVDDHEAHAAACAVV